MNVKFSLKTNNEYINCTGVDTYIHIGAHATEENVPSWNWIWPPSVLNFTAWKEGKTPSGTGGKRCAYMNVNTGLWAPQDCEEGTAFVCEKLMEEKS